MKASELIETEEEVKEVEKSEEQTNTVSEIKKEAEDKKEEISDTTKVTKFNETDYVSIYDFITNNEDKIQNAKIVTFDFKQIPAQKYILLISTHEKDAELYKIDRPDHLFIRSTSPKKILIVNSGICINGSNSRIYVGKSSVTQFHLLEDGNVSHMSSIKKCSKISSENIITVKTEPKEVEVDELKIVCKSITSKMFSLVKDLTDKKIIKQTILDFMDKLNDINYLIKINNEFLAKYKF
tara:strand:+ start:4471 stop:5187 length:717 start_codon:yes stop_codon:yes gene_type:complete